MPIFPAVDYAVLVRGTEATAYADVAAFLSEELPHAVVRAYCGVATRPWQVVRVEQGSFAYYFDAYELLEAGQVVVPSALEEGRLLVACGVSAPEQRARDDYRLRGFLGPTNAVLGKEWDKGHVLGHALGGAVDRWELNVFVQRRDVNRGWSVAGKRYRAMERYCVEHPGTFCFSRPLYVDGLSRAAAFEFGYLAEDRSLVVERFDNS